MDHLKYVWIRHDWVGQTNIIHLLSLFKELFETNNNYESIVFIVPYHSCWHENEHKDSYLLIK